MLDFGVTSYSVIIPAYNEEAYLPNTLENLRDAMQSVVAPGEIIVTDNNSTDRTAEIARNHGAKVVFEAENQIARARNAGARVASKDSEWLFFLDADTTLSAETLGQALDALAGGTCCGGGAVVETDVPMPFVLGSFIWTWNQIARRAGWAAGCFVFCRREAFEAIGGFDERYYASEEVWFSNQLRKWGKQRNMAFRVLSDPPVVTSGRKANWFNSWQFLVQLGLLFWIPWAVRSRRWCSMWYRRPDTDRTLT